MKLFRRRVWKHSRRATILVAVAAVLLLAGGGAVWAGYLGGFGTPTSPNSIDLQKGLVGWWKMDGNAKDSTPYGNDGTLSGITVVQGPIEASVGNQSSITASWPSATTAGNTLVAVLTFNNGPTSPATSPAGWTLRAGSTTTWGPQLYEIVNSSSRSGAETFTWSGNEDATLWLFELSGVDTTTPDDVTVSFSGTGAPSLSPTALGAQAGIAFAVADNVDGCNNSQSIVTGKWVGSDGHRASLGYQFVNGGQTVSASFSVSVCNWKGYIFSFNTPAANRPSLITDREGKANSAYQTGRPKDINIKDSSSLDGPYLTVSAWVYYTASNASQTAVSRIKTASISGDWTLGTGSNGTIGMTIVGKGSVFTPSGTGYAWNKWMMLTGTYDGTNIAFYLNGVLIGTQAASTGGALPAGLDPLTIGGRSDGSYDYQNGGVDDVRVYNRAITAGEVKALYNSYNDPLDIGGSEKSLVGWWKMDGNSKDSSPYSNNGTVTGATLTADRKGQNNSAYSFNGSTQYIQIADQNNFSPSALSYNFSLSLWAMIPTNAAPIGNGSCGGAGGYMIGKGTTGQFEWGLENDSNNKICWNLFTLTGSGAGSAGATKSMNDGQWHLYTITMSSSTIVLYIDGVSVGSNSNPRTMGNGTAPVYIGSRDGTANFMFAGSIDDVRIYSRTLAASEIATLYHSYNSQISLGGSGQSGSVSLGKGLIGYWPFNGNAKDVTPYSNNGTANGAALANDRKGRLNSAYSFNGTNNYIDAGDPTTYDGLKQMTISAWADPTTVPPAGDSTIETVLAKADYNTAPTNAFFLRIRGTEGVQATFSDGTNQVGCRSVTLPATNTWLLITAILQTDGSCQLYLNGQLYGYTQTGTVLSSGIANVASPLRIGRSSWNNSDYFPGYIDDIRIYNRALNANEVKALYDGYN